jgi:hypothetical protein
MKSTINSSYFVVLIPIENNQNELSSLILMIYFQLNNNLDLIV